jgi:hypothetical protein
MIDFSKIKWIIEREEEDGVVVWVSVPKVDEYWKRDDGYYLGRETCNGEARYLRFDDWIKTHTEVWMPVLSLVDRRCISFTDGRHRFAWFRDHGLKAMPVITDRGYGAALRRQVGR